MLEESDKRDVWVSFRNRSWILDFSWQWVSRARRQRRQRTSLGTRRSVRVPLTTCSPSGLERFAQTNCMTKKRNNRICTSGLLILNSELLQLVFFIRLSTILIFFSTCLEIWFNFEQICLKIPPIEIVFCDFLYIQPPKYDNSIPNSMDVLLSSSASASAVSSVPLTSVSSDQLTLIDSNPYSGNITYN